MMERLHFFRRHKTAEAPLETGLRLFPADKARRVVLVTLIGIRPDQQPEIITVISRKFARFDKIVYITDHPDFSHFRRSAAIFEYLPSLAQQERHDAVMDWGGYLAARWDLAQTKWRPETILSYGMNMDSLIAAASLGPGDKEA